MICFSLPILLQLPQCYNGCAQKIQEITGSSKKKKQIKFLPICQAVSGDEKISSVCSTDLYDRLKVSNAQ